ncbi:MAG: thioredoxin family protein [Caldilineales bacterium]|nr:thioredoxin family protein [Caldilineales bacterium]
MTPIVHGLESEYGDRIAFQSFNVGEPEGRQAAETYRVRGHPTILIVNEQGDIVWTRVGVTPLADLKIAIEESINR